MSPVNAAHPLPVEIIETIAKYAERKVLLQLVGISRQGREVTLPWLYHTVAWTNVKQMRQFLKTVPPEHLKWVRRLDLSLMARRWSELTRADMEVLLLRFANIPTSERANLLLQHSQQKRHKRFKPSNRQVAYLEQYDAHAWQAQINRDMSNTTMAWRPKLQCLDVSWTALSEHALCLLLSQCKQDLRELSVARCHIGDMVPIAIATWCPKLERLDLSYTEITDDSLYELARGTPYLTWLNLRGCEFITDDGVLALHQACTKLRWIDLRDCYGVLDSDDLNLGQSALQTSASQSMSMPSSNITNAETVGSHRPGEEDESGWLTESEE
jgi:hypothetical protein